MRILFASARALMFAMVAFGLFASACDSQHSMRATSHDMFASARAAFASDAAMTSLLAPRKEAFMRDGDAFVSEGYRSADQQRFTDLGVRAPARADGAIEVGVSRFEGSRLRVLLRDAAASAAELAQGRVVYANVLPSTHRLLTANATKLEEILILESAEAPHAFRWNIEVPADVTVMTRADGGLSFVRPDGSPLMRMPRVVARDASGRSVPVRSAWDSSTRELAIALDTRAAEYPLAIDPGFETSVWLDAATRAGSIRLGAPLVFDAAREEVVMFGGRTYDGDEAATYSETWVWNGTAWRLRLPGIAPSPRGYTAMAYDAAHRNVVLFGGLNWDLWYRNDTWVWDGATWKEVTPAVSPAARFGASTVYDGARGEVVLFGGSMEPQNTSDPPEWFQDTWVWNGASWTQRSPADKPSKRAGTAMSFDPVRSEAVLFGGYFEGEALDETWIWNGITWAQRTTARAPSRRQGAMITYDGALGKTVLFGGYIDGTSVVGDTWIWDGIDWSESAISGPNPRGFGGMAYDAKHSQTILFGGWMGEGPGVRELGDTWMLAANQWTKVLPLSTPPARLRASMAYDADRRNTVLFGGGVDLAGRNDTWVWDGARWTEQSAAGAPSARVAVSLAFDAARHEVVMFGGCPVESALDDTWTWNGTSWTQKSPTTKPSARCGHMTAFDAARQEIVLFGGLLFARYLAEDTWTWNGTTWTEKLPTTKPLARYYAGMAYHAARQRTVLYGGTSTTGYLADTWTWDGAIWLNVSAPLAPPMRVGAVMVYDPDRARAVLFGGLSRTGELNDTWVWDGAWSSIGSDEAPPRRRRHAMAFDAARHQVVLFGGDSGTETVYGDTWLSATLGGACATQNDCLGGFCTNGVCCNVTSCGTCATCAGTSPGRCTAITNTEDRVTCALANGKSCDADGACKIALGRAANVATDCASGFLADGVCCNEPCNGTCQACRADVKQTADRSGACGPAKDSLDPHDSCTADATSTCSNDGTCDGRGECRLYKRGTACGDVTCVGNRAAGAVCDGLGACGASPAGIDCVAYRCTDSFGCSATCVTNDDCGPFHHCEVGACVADRGATCEGDHVLVSATGERTDCGFYKCEGASCLATCTNRTDCSQDADCTTERTCVIYKAPTPPEEGCGVTPNARANTRFLPWLMLILGVAIRTARKRELRYTR